MGIEKITYPIRKTMPFWGILVLLLKIRFLLVYSIQVSVTINAPYQLFSILSPKIIFSHTIFIQIIFFFTIPLRFYLP